MTFYVFILCCFGQRVNNLEVILLCLKWYCLDNFLVFHFSVSFISTPSFHSANTVMAQQVPSSLFSLSLSHTHKDTHKYASIRCIHTHIDVMWIFFLKFVAFECFWGFCLQHHIYQILVLVLVFVFTFGGWCRKKGGLWDWDSWTRELSWWEMVPGQPPSALCSLLLTPLRLILPQILTPRFGILFQQKVKIIIRTKCVLGTHFLVKRWSLYF